MRAATRHETGALLRAHLAAASGYRHATGRCPVCHRLQRLAMEPGALEPEYGAGAVLPGTPASGGSVGPAVVADDEEDEGHAGGGAPVPAATNNSPAVRE